ncbi:hypothetical protein MF672_009780 [Actinomadura sp. ATCC 31491]|uniref:AI-2E family transporter n=1 Tax=Actinomadura luzonensis TaxID=2805427 RepID=A0ABT0FNZ8_9ACTN|nr:hypothetical protein [Actinomadura luzonensis]MCK2214076.1 hypothetical protein [Actinomadura luzonensis]
MGEQQSDAQPPADAAGSRPLLSSRALLIIVTAVLFGVTVAVRPALAVPIGVSLAVVTLLAKILGD